MTILTRNIKGINAHTRSRLIVFHRKKHIIINTFNAWLWWKRLALDFFFLFDFNVELNIAPVARKMKQVLCAKGHAIISNWVDAWTIWQKSSFFPPPYLSFSLFFSPDSTVYNSFPEFTSKALALVCKISKSQKQMRNIFLLIFRPWLYVITESNAIHKKTKQIITFF